MGTMPVSQWQSKTYNLSYFVWLPGCLVMKTEQDSKTATPSRAVVCKYSSHLPRVALEHLTRGNSELRCTVGIKYTGFQRWH